MKKFTYRFRSLMVNNVERVIPNTVFSRMVIEMDDTSIAEHTIELSPKDILNDKAWIMNFFLTLIIVPPVSALIFGGVYLGAGKEMNSSSWGMVKLIFLLAVIIIILALWTFLSVRSAIANKKRNYVETARGRGNWRIVDESGWDKFYRLLMIAKNQREKDKLIK